MSVLRWRQRKGEERKRMEGGKRECRFIQRIGCKTTPAKLVIQDDESSIVTHIARR